MTLDKEEVEQRIAALNARFDALRPLWVNVQLTLYKEKKVFYLYVSDSGWPVRQRKSGLSLGNHSLGAALALLRSKAADSIEKIFGIELCDYFLSVYGERFTTSRFNLEDGLSIRERLDRLTDAAQQWRKTARTLDVTEWLERWEVENWRQGRRISGQRNVAGLRDLARCLEEAALQKLSPPSRKTQSQKKFAIARSGAGWCVLLEVQKRRIYRHFAEAQYGRRDTAKKEAEAYRDAILAAFFSFKSCDKDRRKQYDKTSDCPSGIHVEKMIGRHAAVSSFPLDTYQKDLPLSDCNKGEAKERAIACREKWLAEMLEATGEREPFSDEEFDATLHKIDTQFGISKK